MSSYYVNPIIAPLIDAVLPKIGEVLCVLLAQTVWACVMVLYL